MRKSNLHRHPITESVSNLPEDYVIVDSEHLYMFRIHYTLREAKKLLKGFDPSGVGPNHIVVEYDEYCELIKSGATVNALQ